jgi:hypothetical protein
MRPLAPQDVRWLKSLDKNLWNRYPSSDRRRGSSFERRELTQEEWDTCVALVRAYELPCELHSGCYGNLWISIFRNADSPDSAPKRMCSIGQRNLPDAFKLHGYNELHPMAWKAFSPLTHAPKNKQLLTFYDLKPSGEESSYEY